MISVMGYRVVHPADHDFEERPKPDGYEHEPAAARRRPEHSAQAPAVRARGCGATRPHARPPPRDHAQEESSSSSPGR